MNVSQCYWNQVYFYIFPGLKVSQRVREASQIAISNQNTERVALGYTFLDWYFYIVVKRRKYNSAAIRVSSAALDIVPKLLEDGRWDFMREDQYFVIFVIFDYISIKSSYNFVSDLAETTKLCSYYL